MTPFPSEWICTISESTQPSFKKLHTERWCLWSVFSCTFSTFFGIFGSVDTRPRASNPLVLSPLPCPYLVRPHYTLSNLPEAVGTEAELFPVTRMHNSPGALWFYFFNLFFFKHWVLTAAGRRLPKFQADRVFLGNKLSSKFSLCDRFLDQCAAYLIKHLSETTCGTLPLSHGAVPVSLLNCLKTIEDDTANSKQQMLLMCRYRLGIIP